MGGSRSSARAKKQTITHQAVQLACPMPAKKPGAHGVHAAEPGSAENEPAGLPVCVFRVCLLSVLVECAC